MAKKSFNISSTLSKNKESQLAPKVPLKKTIKNDEKLKEDVARIHGEETAASKAPAGKSAVRRKTPKPAVDKLVRLTIDTPVEMHKKLKIKSIEKGVSMRDYILELIHKELN